MDYNQPKLFRTNELSSGSCNMTIDHSMADSLSKEQFGFKMGTSSVPALHKIAHIIEGRNQNSREGIRLSHFP